MRPGASPFLVLRRDRVSVLRLAAVYQALANALFDPKRCDIDKSVPAGQPRILHIQDRVQAALHRTKLNLQTQEYGPHPLAAGARRQKT